MRAVNWMLALLIVLLAAALARLDEKLPAPVLADHRQVAAQEMCGPDSYAVWLDDDTVACRGRKSKK